MRLLAALALLAAAGCVRPTADAGAGAAGDVTVTGTVASVDTAPWAYDGNAVLVVATDAGDVRVELPARWNLCAATGIGLGGELAPGDAVEVVGERTDAGAVVPCTRAAHRVARR